MPPPRKAAAARPPSVAGAAKAVALGRTDWIRAGQDLLCKDGIAGMRLMKLTKRLRVSTGSFYHHFEDMDDFLTALAQYFNAGQVQSLVDEITAANPDPYERIRQLALRSFETELFKLDAAMRIWATSDARAQVSVRESETIVIRFLTRAFRDAGFGRADASLRAQVVLSVTVGRLLSNSDLDYRRLREDLLRLMLNMPLQRARS